MREIKFRGKRIDTGEWVYGWYLKATGHWHKRGIHEDWIICHAMQNGGWFALGSKHAVAPETVGQFTELKDKNGVNIYEGDIVWCRAGEHRSGVWEYENRFVVEYGWSQSMWEMSMCDEIELIGNIHDNPEK